MEISGRDLFLQCDDAYLLGLSEGKAKGAITGFIGGIVFCACLYGMNYLNNLHQNPPTIQQPQPPTQSQPIHTPQLNKSLLNKVE